MTDRQSRTLGRTILPPSGSSSPQVNTLARAGSRTVRRVRRQLLRRCRTRSRWRPAETLSRRRLRSAHPWVFGAGLHWATTRIPDWHRSDNFSARRNESVMPVAKAAAIAWVNMVGIGRAAVSASPRPGDLISFGREQQSGLRAELSRAEVKDPTKPSAILAMSGADRRVKLWPG